jgi:Tol biopolymer transport system component
MNLSPDGKKFVTYDELSGIYERSPKRAASLWDVQTGEYRSLPEGLQSHGRFSPDGQRLAMDEVDEKGYSRALKLFDSQTGQERLSVAVKDKNAQHAIVGFSPDGRLMMDSCSVYEEAKKRDNSHAWLKWLDAITGREVASFPAEPKESFSNTRFSSDGQILAATNWQGEKTKLFLFSVPDKKLVRTIFLGEKKKGEWLSMTEPAFSPDGKWLAIITQVSPDTRADLDVHDIAQPRILLIDVATGEIRETLIAPQSFSGSPCFSPDGQTLATTGHGRVLLWDMTKIPGQTARVRE